ncbi:tyrosine-protein kinase domain-containing protein [soil metagenome]
MNTTFKGKEQEDELDLGNFIRELLNKWHYFLIAGIIFTILTIVYIKFSLPVYQASSSILIEDSKSSSKDIEDILSSDLFGSSLSLPTEIGIMMSRTVMIKTIDQLKLRVAYVNTSSIPSKPIYPKYPFIVQVNYINRFIQELPFEVNVIDSTTLEVMMDYSGSDLPGFTQTQKMKFGDTIKNDYYNLTIFRNDSAAVLETGTTFEFKVRSENKLVLEILDNLKIEPLDKDANIVILTYQDVIPVRSMDILNSIGKVYIDLDIQDKASVAALTLKFVDEQMNSTGQALSATEHEMQAFQEKNKTVDLSEESKSILQKLNDLDVERAKSDIEIASLKNLYNYVSKNKDLTTMAPSSLGVADPLLVELITNFQALQSKRQSLSYGVKDDAPAVKILDQQIKENRATLIENILNISQRLEITKISLDKQLANYDAYMKRVPEVERELLGIKRNFEVNQNIYTYLLQKKAETSIAKATVVSDNKILDQASLADEPVAPNKKILAVLILLFTVAIPSSYLIAKSILRTTVNNRDDINKIPTIPVLGVVGHSIEKTNLAVFEKPKSAIAEGFRTLRTNLQFYGLNAGSKVILITSSVGGEGKSFVTMNLATVLAMQQIKVIVVGLDLRKPKLFQDFGFKNEIGVSNYLVGNASIDQVIRKTTIPCLDLISAGPIPPNPAELLSKKAMEELVEELKKRYDIVVIDTPPIGIVSDAFIVMPLADINLYIVRQGYSKYEYIKSLNDLYLEKKFKSLSIVLNDSDFSRSYGYGYGHSYGYANGASGYYEEEQPKGNFFSRMFSRRKNS